MGATFEHGGSDIKYQRLESGMYPAHCIQVVELGTHDNTHPQAKPGAVKKEILLVFETNELMEPNEEGKQLPLVVSLRLTNSLGQRATLRKHLESWRGKSFTDDELASFSTDKILDKPCLLNVTLTRKGDKEYNNIKTINPVPKGMTVSERVNELIDFGIHDIEQPIFQKLWPWVQTIIKNSYEAKALDLPEPDSDPGESDSIPF